MPVEERAGGVRAAGARSSECWHRRLVELHELRLENCGERCGDRGDGVHRIARAAEEDDEFGVKANPANERGTAVYPFAAAAAAQFFSGPAEPSSEQ